MHKLTKMHDRLGEIMLIYCDFLKVLRADLLKGMRYCRIKMKDESL